MNNPRNNAKCVLEEYFGKEQRGVDDSSITINLKWGAVDRLSYYWEENLLSVGSLHSLSVAPEQLKHIAKAVTDVRKRMRILGYRLSEYESADGCYLMYFEKQTVIHQLRGEIEKLFMEFQPPEESQTE